MHPDLKFNSFRLIILKLTDVIVDALVIGAGYLASKVCISTNNTSYLSTSPYLPKNYRAEFKRRNEK